MCGQNQNQTLPTPQTPQETFSKEVFIKGEASIPYRLSLPLNYDKNKKYPLLLFLHGAGERGNDNEIQLNHIDKIFDSQEFRQQYPCIIIVPQCPEGKRWVETDWGAASHTQPENMSEPLDLTMTLLLSSLMKYNIDKNRVYVVGLSMGGFGVWDVITRFPNIFSAAVPICGGGDEKLASKIVNMPIWAFHGTKDPVVKVSRSRNMVEAIANLGGHPKYTEYPTKGHGVWNSAFQTKNLWKWLFNQNKNTEK